MKNGMSCWVLLILVFDLALKRLSKNCVFDDHVFYVLKMTLANLADPDDILDHCPICRSRANPYQSVQAIIRCIRYYESIIVKY
jgi:hypothetical protein